MNDTITLTDEQARAAAGNPDGIRLRAPGTSAEYVLVRADVFDKLLESQHDDSSWTPEERDSLTWEAGKHAGWDQMSEYDNYPEMP